MRRVDKMSETLCKMSETLCKSCDHVREIVSGTGSRFLLCRLAQADATYPKYPPQPVVHCAGFNPRPAVEKP
jgi:hypothetical protein